MSISEELERVGRRVQRLERSLKGSQAERRSLIAAALSGGMSERDVAELARCAPSFVHRVGKGRA